MKKHIISWTLFLIDFLLILGSSWVDFWWIWGAKLRAKLAKNSIIWPLVGKLAEVAKMLQNYYFFQYFWLPRPVNFEAKFNKKRTQTDQNSSKQFGQHLDPIFNGFGRPTWVQDPSKNPPKSFPKSIKIQSKITYNI